MNFVRFFLIVSVVSTGCQSLTRGRQEARIVEPALPTTLTRMELVDYLNARTMGLSSWRCDNTQVRVSSPEIPFPQKLKGTLACSAPGHFRLVCDNTLGHADFGANEQICWAYVKPGDSVVMTWKHDDSSLLRHLPGGLPRLEPSWLMTVLGVQPIDPEYFELQKPPRGSRELWLVAVEDAPDGTSLRRVIKVDTVQGVIRRHALYDCDAKPLLIADLSDYRTSGRHQLPHTIHISFPAMETELTLKFAGIETDCHIAESLWQPPAGRSLEHVDLGKLVRSRMAHDPRFAQQAALSNSGSTKPRQASVARAVSPASDEQRTALRDSAELADAGIPGRSDLSRFDQTRKLDHAAGFESGHTEFGDQSPDERYFQSDEFRPQSANSSGSGTRAKVPEWDVESLHPNAESAGREQMSDEEFRHAIMDESVAPDFDIISPGPSARRRLFRLPFQR